MLQPIYQINNPTITTTITYLSGFHVSVKNTMEMVSPNVYSCRPQHPTAFMIDALWIVCTFIPRSFALSIRSEWVVAL